MDGEDINMWISQPDVCRCCLSANGSWDVTASYITDTGNKEVIIEMLIECYGIALNYLKDWAPSKLVCRLCVDHLRDACIFKKQVLNSERLFVEYCSGNEIVSDNDRGSIKVETESINNRDSPVCVSDDIIYTNDDIKERIKSKRTNMKIVTKENQINRKRQNTHLKVKRKRRDNEIDETDSDTPISLLKKGKEKIDGNKALEVGGKSDMLKKETPIDIQERLPSSIQLQNVKQVSERKRVILTCDTVLKYTTACPFRHHKSWFQCFYCTQDFIEINQLRNHTLQAHNDIESELKQIKRYPRSLQIEISNFECRHCCSNLTDVKTMRRHFEDVHETVVYEECIADYKVDISPYKCHLCGKQYHVFRSLTTHLNEHYANCICDVCGKSFLNTKRLKVHKRIHENGQYPCSKCGKVLKTKISKANHMESVHSKRIIKCQICFKPMKHYNQRVKHMSEVHNITHYFKCPICPREYNIKHYLATHMRQTHGNKNKKCPECGMAFITNHSLNKHMLRHTGVKAYSCEVCCKTYARSYTLKEHMRAHGTERFLGPE